MTARRNRVARWYNIETAGYPIRQTDTARAARRVARLRRLHTSAPIVISVREQATTFENPPDGHPSFASRPYRSGWVKAWGLMLDGRFRRLPVRRSTHGGKLDDRAKEDAGNAILKAAGGE